MKWFLFWIRHPFRFCYKHRVNRAWLDGKYFYSCPIHREEHLQKMMVWAYARQIKNKQLSQKASEFRAEMINKP